MSDERPVNHINLKDALRSFSQDSKVLLLEDADVAVLFGRALAEIEKLEAEVERLKEEQPGLSYWQQQGEKMVSDS